MTLLPVKDHSKIVSTFGSCLSSVAAVAAAAAAVLP